MLSKVEYRKQWVANRPFYGQVANLRHRGTRGWTTERAIEYLDAQEGQCAICGGTFGAEVGSPCLDHDHSSNEPRGLLCRRCNTAIGMVNDNVEVLASASEYLGNWK